MTRNRRRRVAIAVAVLAFLLVSAFVTRWLQADNAERAKVERLLEAQAAGDAGAMAAELHGCDEACAAELDRLARRLRRPGTFEVLRYDSATSHALTGETGPTRVAWRVRGGDPVVQCVTVSRSGTALTGPGVRLLDLSAPIGREASC